jgi:hypothetical protein
MVGTLPQPSGADRLARVADMVTNAVALLQQAMDEIRADQKGTDDDDGDAAGAPDGDIEQPG